MTDRIVVDGRFSDEAAKVVWKWELPVRAEPLSRLIPVGSRLVHVEYGEAPMGFSGLFTLWYEVELANKDNLLSHVYQIWGTGDDTIPHSARHIGVGIEWNEDHRNRRTSPERVWHLYEFASGAKVVDA